MIVQWTYVKSAAIASANFKKSCSKNLLDDEIDGLSFSVHDSFSCILEG